MVPQVQAVFPQGALTKKIKVGLQVNMFRNAARHTFSRPEHVYLKANFNLLGEGALGENILYLGHHCAIDDSTECAVVKNLLPEYAMIKFQ